MKETTKAKKGRREWVKNAIIIFLAVLLVLTFFSNTIMNYSLPEVAAQYPRSTAITTKIRGSGVVEAAQTYNVQVDETRKVASVEVKVGDVVSAGQTLLTLDAQESQELTAARAEYDSLKLEYDKMTLTVGEQSFAGELTMQQLKDAVTEAQEALYEAQGYEDDLKYYQEKVEKAQDSVDARQAEAAAAQKNLALLENDKANIEYTNEEYLSATRDIEEIEEKIKEHMDKEPQKYMISAPTMETSATDEEETLNGEESIGEEENADTEDPADEEENVDTEEPTGEEESTETEPELTPEYIKWQEELDELNAQLADAMEQRAELKEDIEFGYDQRIAVQNAALINANAGVTSTSNTLSSAQNDLSRFQSEYTGTYTTAKAAEEALKAAKDALAAAEATAADDEVQTVYDDAVAELDKNALAEKLKTAEETVKALEEHAAGVEVQSRYGGVVTEVNVSAGDTTEAQMTLVSVELTQQGYTMSATVTKEQAKTLRQGLTAEITNLWNSDINLVLQSITNDKNDPANSRVLNFSVQGEVAVGQELSFSIGDKNANYDVVLPSAAVHNDADGSFVYTVAVKSSPLGNRYTVRRTEVTVLASDETNSAVSGDISTADFVITTSTLPLEEGDQIRIAE